MPVIDDMIIKPGFEADGAIAEMKKTVAALAEVSAPAIRLACLDRARDIISRDYYSESHEQAHIDYSIAIADLLAAFVLHGTVPAKI